MSDGMLLLCKSKEKNIPGATPPSTNNAAQKGQQTYYRMITVNVPFPFCTNSNALLTCPTFGLANTFPAALALNSPSPTNPTCAGSWPLPPPEMRATRSCGMLRSAMTRYWESRWRWGWLCARPRRDWGTVWDGSLMMCLSIVWSFDRCSEESVKGDPCDTRTFLNSVPSGRSSLRLPRCARA
jgi:hypothetical protein